MSNGGALYSVLIQFISARAKENQKTSTGGINPQLSANLPEAAIDTREELAKSSGVSHSNIPKVENILSTILAPVEAHIC